MGSAEVYYAKVDAEKARIKAKNARGEIAEYNRKVNVIKEISSEIYRIVKANPPARYSWVDLNGKKTIAYFYFQCKSTRSVYAFMLSNGKMAFALTCNSGDRFDCKILDIYDNKSIEDMKCMSIGSLKEVIGDIVEMLCDQKFLNDFGIKNTKWVPSVEYRHEVFKKIKDDRESFLRERRERRRSLIKDWLCGLGIVMGYLLFMALVCAKLMYDYYVVGGGR